MSMQVYTARVRDGAIVLYEGVQLLEGSRVTVIVGDNEATFELTPEQEAELAESIAEADRGEVAPAVEVLRRVFG